MDNRNNLPLVSVVIPCYNHEDYIADCIESLLNQTYENMEILICDDCSTDNSWNIIKQYEEAMKRKLRRVILLRNESNQGVTKNANLLLKKAEGELIKEFASDDMLIRSDAIEALVCFMINNKEVDVLLCNGIYLPEPSRFHAFSITDYQKIYKERPVVDKERLFGRLYHKNHIFAPGIMIWKRIFLNHGYYDEQLVAEDWEFWLRIAGSGQVEFGYIDECFIGYRLSDNSLSARTNNDLLELKRIRMHETEMKIVERYKEKVLLQEYADKKLSLILEENKLAVKFHLNELLKITCNEFENFNEWKMIGFKKKIWLIRKIVFRRVILHVK